jgi:hypothetical protein
MQREVTACSTRPWCRHDQWPFLVRRMGRRGDHRRVATASNPRSADEPAAATGRGRRPGRRPVLDPLRVAGVASRGDASTVSDPSSCPRSARRCGPSACGSPCRSQESLGTEARRATWSARGRGTSPTRLSTSSRGTGAWPSRTSWSAPTARTASELARCGYGIVIRLGEVAPDSLTQRRPPATRDVLAQFWSASTDRPQATGHWRGRPFGRSLATRH